METGRKKINFKLLYSVLALILVSGAIWYLADKQKEALLIDCANEPELSLKCYHLMQPNGPVLPENQTSTAVDPIANWKTYRNDQYGFEFKYPAELVVSEDGPYNSQSGTQPSNLGTVNVGESFSIQIFNPGIVDYDWPERPCGEWTFGPDDKPLLSERVIFSGNKTLHVVSRGFPAGEKTDYYCVNYPKNPLVIYFSESQASLANQILSTFKFIDSTSTQVNTSNWKTYRNDQYGFEFQYTGTINAQSDALNNITLSFISFNDFNLGNYMLDNGSDEETLKYNQAKNQWEITPGINQGATDTFCPISLQTKSQHVPYYQIGDSRSGRNWDFAYVTKKGIIVLSVLDGELPFRIDPTGKSFVVDPSQVKFDNLNDTLSVNCKPGAHTTFTIPPSGFNWQLVEGKDRIHGDNEAYYYNEDPSIWGGINFTGKEWIYKTSDEKKKVQFPDETADGYKVMTDNGWFVEIPYKNFKVDGIVADGAGSSHWAYVKLENNRLSVLGFGYNTTFNGPETPEEWLNCPCDFEYRVFLGDPVDIDSVLPK